MQISKFQLFTNFFLSKKTRTQTQDLVSYLAPCRRVLLNVNRNKLTFSPQTIITAFLAKLQKNAGRVIKSGQIDLGIERQGESVLEIEGEKV